MSNETTELVQQLIRNECVNDGTLDSGHESKNADVLETLFNRNSLDVERHHSVPGRDSLVARLTGSDKSAPSLLLLGHTDVVPAHAPDWENDPFGGELIDGVVHGRGAVDMFNITASMAIALSSLSSQGYTPRGDVIFAAVADEENGGTHGAKYLIENHSELVDAEFVLSESGGTHMPVGDTTYLPVVVGEKGVHWITIDIPGTPSHGSKPYGADNSIISGADIINRFIKFAPPVQFAQGWQTFLEALGIEKSLSEKLSDTSSVDEALKEVNAPLDSVLHSCSHQTFSPNVIHGGVKVNTVADATSLSFDIRSLPNTTLSDVQQMIDDALGDYKERVTVHYLQNTQSSMSATETPLWNALRSVSQSLVPGSEIIPTISTFGTDSRYWREKGKIAYGAALFDSDDTDYANHLNMFHGRNEQVSTKSLQLTTDLYIGIIRSLYDFV